MKAAIETRQLSKRYRRTTALDAVSLQVPVGSTYALVGANGAGKTTLIKLLMNILPPSAGEATVLGVASTSVAGGVFESIAYVSENQEMPESITVKAFLEYVRSFYPQWDAGLEAQMVREFALPLNRKLKALSRGMKMKAALVSVLAYKPALIVLDEPFSGLDPLVRDEFIQSLVERSGTTTILISSHDLSEIESFATHVGYLESGWLLFSAEMTALAARFRAVEVVTSEGAAVRLAEMPSTWLQVKMEGNVLRFVDSQFGESTGASLVERFGTDAKVTVTAMPLRAMFLAIARAGAFSCRRCGCGRWDPMKQALHIFAKDSRRLWPEILMVLVVTVVYAKLAPQLWGAQVVNYRIPAWLPSLMVGLLPVGWWLLISRSVHGESLVGERQFWVTRPYRWGSLLAAKVLFISGYVVAPYFLALCMVMREGGFHPTEHIGGLLYESLLAVCIVVMPLLVLSAVTSSFGKVTLAVLIVLAFVGLVGWLTTRLPTSSTSGDYGMVTCTVLLELGFAGVIVLQCARRRTALARMLIAVIALIIALVGLFGPEELPMRKVYPTQASARALPLKLEFDTQRPDSTLGTLSDDGSGEILIEIPMNVSGIGPAYAVKTENAKVTITAQDGESWSSHWQESFLTWLPGTAHDTVSLKMNRRFVDRIKDAPVRIELTMALMELQAGEWTRVRVPSGQFTLPGGSLCRAGQTESDGISCRSALRHPPLMLVATRFATQPCSRDRVLVADGDVSMDWVGSTDTDPAEFGLTSVLNEPISFRNYSGTGSNREQYLCPGAFLAVARYTVRDRRQISVTSPLIKLDDYRPKSMM